MTDTQTVGAAVEQVQAAPRMLDAQNFAAVLPAHIGAEKFQRWALTLLKDPKMAEVARTDAGRLSIMSALMDCASLGLEPGRTYHLVPFGGEVTGITDYKGEVELIWRAVQRPVVASLVYAKDEFHMTGANIPPVHDADWFAEGGRGTIKGGYAFVQFEPDACSLVVRMTEAEFVRHRAKAKTKAVWDEWPESMRLKTLVHQLRKWVPWSAEVQS
jgi:phage RecT family recombinase